MGVWLIVPTVDGLDAGCMVPRAMVEFAANIVAGELMIPCGPLLFGGVVMRSDGRDNCESSSINSTSERACKAGESCSRTVASGNFEVGLPPGG